MWMAVGWLGVFVRPLVVGPGSIPWCKSWLFGAHFLWWNALFSLDAMGRSFVPPQLKVPGFVDSSWEALPFLRYGWEVDWLGSGGSRRRRGKTIVSM